MYNLGARALYTFELEPMYNLGAITLYNLGARTYVKPWSENLT